MTAATRAELGVQHLVVRLVEAHGTVLLQSTDPLTWFSLWKPRRGANLAVRRPSQERHSWGSGPWIR